MKGMCQTCGASGPLEWFLRLPEERAVLVAAVKLPQAVQDRLVDYLSLFRPATGKSMAPKKALRLISEIDALVSRGYVTVAGRIDRPATPGHWSLAMEQMIETRHLLTLPMANHKYLSKIVWDMADKDAAAREKKIVEGERTGLFRTASQPREEPATDWAAMTEAEWLMLPATVRAKHEHERG